MNNWTRAHDAWIARECEGLEVHENMHGCDWGCFPPDEGFRWRRLTNYNTDPAAAIRAAEAWRKKDEDNRWYQYESPLGREDHLARVWRSQKDNCAFGSGDTFATALAQALYRATGGPA